MAESRSVSAPSSVTKHLTVLVRVHRARIDVDVRVELLHSDLETPVLEAASQDSTL